MRGGGNKWVESWRRKIVHRWYVHLHVCVCVISHLQRFMALFHLLTNICFNVPSYIILYLFQYIDMALKRMLADSYLIISCTSCQRSRGIKCNQIKHA